ncbi:MAG: sialidase family protein, partial [Planctomycetota bacterium]
MRTIVCSLLFVITCTASAAAQGDARIQTGEKPAARLKITMGEPHVIVRGIRPEERLWGPYQFPRPYRLGDRFVVSVHITDDNISNYGAKALWFESRDEGQTWKEVAESVVQECGLLLTNGDRVYFPPESGVDVSKYQQISWNKYTPDYDFSKQAEEGTLPIPDGMTFWMGGTTINAFNADRLPPSLSQKEWTLYRIPAGQTKPMLERARVDWPYLTRVVHVSHNGKKVLKSIFPRGNPKRGPDGAIWVSVFSGEGHLNPENGQYSPYYSAEIFRSEDNGRTFQRRSHLEYEADGHEFPYKSGGFSDSDFEFMPDGSIVWFLRSTWYSSTGKEWDPMYMTRSTDDGRTWSKPVQFDKVGILPRLCRLDCGVTLLCYARPGTFVRAALNDSG